jgi:hypothetical protein
MTRLGQCLGMSHEKPITGAGWLQVPAGSAGNLRKRLNTLDRERLILHQPKNDRYRRE